MSGRRILSGLGSYLKRHHLGLLALVVALSGTAYAAQKSAPKNSVVAKSIKKGAVTGPKLAPNSVDGSKVTDRSLTGADIDASTLGTVPSATAATNAANAAAAAQATTAADAEKLGGSAASAFVKEGELGAFGTAGLDGIGGAKGCAAGLIGPTVAFEVPASGLVEVLARATTELTGGGSTTGCIVVDGTGSTTVFFGAGSTTFYTESQSSEGTIDPLKAGWLPFFLPPGPHTFALAIGYAPGFGLVVEDRLLMVRAPF